MSMRVENKTMSTYIFATYIIILIQNTKTVPQIQIFQSINVILYTCYFRFKEVH